MTIRLFEQDSTVVEFAAIVTDVREKERRAGQQIWQIALDRTAFYPEGGGQPSDVGLLRAESRSGAILEVVVEAVEEDEISGQIWHWTNRPIAQGTAVTAEVDWSRRHDHMQQHSGQHLLSAVLEKNLAAKTISFHLGADLSTIDLDRAEISSDQLAIIEREANAQIAANLPVTSRYVDRAEAESLLAAGLLRKLPPREGTIRLIEMAGLDLNACGGTHVRSTGEIGALLLRRTEKIRGGLRLEFLCGKRAIAAARADDQLLSQLSALLSAGRSEMPAAIERQQVERKTLAKEKEALREELAALLAANLSLEEGNLLEWQPATQCATPLDAALLRLIVSKAIAANPASALLAWLPLGSERASVVLAVGKQTGIDSGKLLKEAMQQLGLRAGGSCDLAQTELPVASLDSLLTTLREQVVLTQAG
jgi:alanyl-tRNA synthetase